MKKAIIIALLIAQANSMSFYDVFAPVEDSLGRLVSDVVTDIKDTIDCTILAVEHVFSIDGIFGRRSDYDEKCKGDNAVNNEKIDENPSTDETFSIDDTQDYDQDDMSEEEDTQSTVSKSITKEIEETVSDASQRIQNIIDNSNSQAKMENVKISIRNETNRLIQISVILRHEIEKLPDEVRKKLRFNIDEPTLDDVFDEVKLLYEVEQRDKSSAEANEVRRIFNKVLDYLHVNEVDGPLSDEDEVKLILTSIGKSSNESLIDIEQKVSLWTEEQKQEIKDIQDVVNNTTNVTQRRSENNNDDSNTTNIDLLVAEKLDEIETEQAKMVDFSKSLKDLTKNILDEVSAISSLASNVQSTSPSILFDHSGERTKESEIAELSQKNKLTNQLTTEPTETTTIFTSSLQSDSTQNQTKFSQQNDINVLPITQSTETNSVSNGSLQSDPTLIQTSTVNSSIEEMNQSKDLTSDSIESTSQINELISTTTSPPTLTVTSTEQFVQSNNQDQIFTTTQIPIIAQDATKFNQSQTSTETGTSTIPLSSDTTKSYLPEQSSQISSTSIQTLQSNIQTVTTAMQSSLSNAQLQQQQVEAVPQDNIATAQISQMNAQSYSSSTAMPPAIISQTNQVPPLTVPSSTELPKSFKDLAQRLFSNDPQNYKEYDDYGSPVSEGEAKELNLAVFNKLFGAQNEEEQQQAVEGAKNLIEESEKANAFFNNFFKDADHDAAPSVFDDPDSFVF